MVITETLNSENLLCAIGCLIIAHDFICVFFFFFLFFRIIPPKRRPASAPATSTSGRTAYKLASVSPVTVRRELSSPIASYLFFPKPPWAPGGIISAWLWQEKQSCVTGAQRDSFVFTSNRWAAQITLFHLACARGLWWISEWCLGLHDRLGATWPSRR